MGNERTQVNLAVNPERKERWEEYIEETNEADSLSHLIRLSVEREINRDSLAEQTTEVDLTGIDERFDAIEAQLDDLSTEMKQLTEEEKVENIKELASDLYEEIPRIEDEITWIERIESGQLDPVLPIHDSTDSDPAGLNLRDEVLEEYVTVRDLAIKLQVSEYRAKQAVDEIELSFPRVRTHERNESIYVYEVE